MRPLFFLFICLAETLPTLNYCSLLDSEILRAGMNYTFDSADNDGFEALPNQAWEKGDFNW